MPFHSYHGTFSVSAEVNSLNLGELGNQDLNDFFNVRNPATFLFRMKSSALKNAGIYLNDVIVCRRDLVVLNHDLIVCSVNGRFLVRYYDDGAFPKLRAAHERIGDIDLQNVKDCRLFGKVSGVIRKGNLAINLKRRAGS